MFKRISFPVFLLSASHALSALLLAGSLYLVLYPSFFGFAYPNNTSLNLLWLLFLTPMIFEIFFLQLILKAGHIEQVSLFAQRTGFDILIKSSYMILILLLSPDISLTQIRLFFVFLISLVFDSLKFYFLIRFAKRRKA